MFEYIKEISSFNVSEFHFLRIQYLWLFVPVVLILLFTLIQGSQNTKWKKVIAPALQPFVITKEKKTAAIYPVILFIVLMSLGIVGLAGPTWKKINVDGAKTEAVLLIALDVSQSMMAQDIQPNRLERAKFKVMDLLKENPQTKVALYAYAGTPHTVVPVCSDYDIIKHHINSVSPEIMPVKGTNLSLLMHQVDSTLAKIEAPSTVLLITDNITNADAKILQQFTANTKHNIEILLMTTANGATIPQSKNKQKNISQNGALIISKPDMSVINKMEEADKIHIINPTLDSSDMEALAAKVKKHLFYQQDDKESEEQWQDMGFILVILCVIIMPFWFRKGWMLQYSILILLGTTSCKNAYWQELWYTKDYQAQKLYEEGQFEEAGNTFTSPIHKGVAYFKAGNYDAAAQAFEQDSSATSLYNLSLSYAQLGEYDKALTAIEKASALDPQNVSYQRLRKQTETTKMYVDSLSTNQPITEMPENNGKKTPLRERKPKSKDDELSADNKVDQLPQEGDRITDEVDSDIHRAKEAEEVPEDFKSDNSQSPQKILLQGISEDPSEFLKRRFKFQYKKHYSNQTDSPEPW